MVDQRQQYNDNFYQIIFNQIYKFYLLIFDDVNK